MVVTDPTGGDVGGTYALSFNGQAANISAYAIRQRAGAQPGLQLRTNTTTATIVVPAG